MLKLGIVSSIAALAMTATVAHAQNVGGPVTVNLGGIQVSLADTLDVKENQIPVSVQAPVSVAANVCGQEVNALAQQIEGGNAECDAQSTSDALNRIILRQIN